jgi:hypothetical protein
MINMNRDEHILKRLLKAAGQSRRETPVSLPFALEARILAGWRSAAPEEDPLIPAVFFQRAAICAVLIMVVSIGWSQLSNAREVPGAIALAQLARGIQIAP